MNINEAYAASWGSVDAPMGGMKNSGFGRLHGLEGMLRFVETQTIAVQHGRLLGALFGEAAQGYATLTTKALSLARGMRLPF